MPPVIKHMELPELREALRPIEAMEPHTIDPSVVDCDFRLNTRGQIAFRVGEQNYGLLSDSYVNLCAYLGVPEALLKKVPEDLMLPVVNFFLREGNRRELGYAVMDYKGEPAIPFFSRGAMDPISNLRVLDILNEVAPEAQDVWHVSVNPFATSYSVVSTIDRPVARVGDVVHQGFNFENSYALTKPFSVSVYNHTLRCTNGQISTDQVFRMSKRGLGGDGTDDWIRDAIQQARSAADVEFEHLNQLTNVRFDSHMGETLDSMFESFNVPTVVASQVRSRVIDSGDRDMYSLMNIVTDVASNDPEIIQNPDLSRRLMQVGGRMLAHSNVCPECHRVVD